MMHEIGRMRAVALEAAMAAILLGLPAAAIATPHFNPVSGVHALAAQGQQNALSNAQSRIKGKQFSAVHVSVDANGIATLTGSVDLYEYKSDAEKRVSKAKGVTGVRNQIQVAGPTVSDAELKAKLGEKLAYDRVGFGNVFNAIGLNVHNGVVTVGGHARTYVDRDSAIALVSTYPGVKDVIDEIEVDPTSIMDDQTRMAVARAIYGSPTLNRYAMDPAKPIRISVQNGNVSLFGTVDSQADRDTANIRARSVPGVFSVKNYLQVAGQPTESKN